MSEWFENGILRVLVPSGWKLFYGIDSEGNASPRNLHIFKGAQTEFDVFSKAGVTVFYHGKDENNPISPQIPLAIFQIIMYNSTVYCDYLKGL